jgi:acyl carrier protein
MFRVFISYATEDESFAVRLANDLQRLGAQTWLAQQSIRPGESWVSAIERGLRGSSHMAVVLTPAAAASPWVQKEIEVAISRERSGQMELIPLNVQSCDVPLLLQSYQWVSFQRGYEAGLSRLADVLGLRAAPAPGRAAVQARFLEILSDLGGLLPEDIALDSRMSNDLMLDELDLVELAIMVEEEWNVAVPDDGYLLDSSAGALGRTVGDWVTYLTRNVGR